MGRPGAQVNWKVARNIVVGRLLTLPAAAATPALVFAIIELLGGGAFGAKGAVEQPAAMIPLAEIVEVAPLLEAIWTSVVFGLFVLIVAGIGVSASLRAADQHGEHHERGFASWGLVTIGCGVLFVAAVVLGIWAMTQ